MKNMCLKKKFYKINTISKTKETILQFITGFIKNKDRVNYLVKDVCVLIKSENEE